MTNKAKNYILIQKNDLKSQGWSEAAKRQNLGQLTAISGSSMHMPFALIKYLFRLKIPAAIVFRYLNDYPSFFRTILRTFTDFLTILIAKSFGIFIFWICHNVDKESVSHYPKITLARRSALGKFSKKIFVLDDLLINPCIDMLGVSEKKICSICFGRTDIFNESENRKSNIVDQTIAMIRNWEYFKKSQSGETLIGLWIGSPSEKLLHGLRLIAKIAKRPTNGDANVAFVVIGPIGNWLQQRDFETHDVLNNKSTILMIDKYIDLPVCNWKDVCDFIWKPSSDWSINLTTYNSALARLPIVALKGSFLGEFIRHYRLGITIDPERFSLVELMNNVQQWNADYAFLFLKRKTWDYGAKKFFEVAKKV